MRQSATTTAETQIQVKIPRATRAGALSRKAGMGGKSINMDLSSDTYFGTEQKFLDGSDVKTRLGFGCAGLMQLPTRRRRQRLLATAYDLGLRHFDVARMYGLGAGEAEVGRFLRGRPDATVATKFGIEPPAAWMARLQAPARVALAAVPALKSRLKDGGADLSPPRRYDAAGARRSLETSLRELGRDHVDLFLVHDPRPEDVVDVGGIAALANDLRSEGSIGAWGFSGDPEPCIDLTVAAGPEAVLQVRDEILAPAPIPRDRALVVFGVLGRDLEVIAAHLTASELRRREWSDEIGMDCSRPDVLASLLLQDALVRNPRTNVLFSTTRPVRLRGALASAAAVERDPNPASLTAFRRRVAGELGDRAMRNA